MFEAIGVLIEAVAGLLEGLVLIVDAIAVSADIYAWIKGKDNRAERRIARKAGEPVPPRDRWNRRVIWLSVLIAALTTGLIIWGTMHVRAKKRT